LLTPPRAADLCHIDRSAIAAAKRSAIAPAFFSPFRRALRLESKRCCHSDSASKEVSMPLIKARTRGKQLVRHITRFDRETNETLYAYAHFLGEPTEYVLNQLVDTMLAKDREFVAWRAEHPESYVTRRVPHRPRSARRASSNRTGPVPAPVSVGGARGEALA
jgi:hypothetical protein